MEQTAAILLEGNEYNIEFILPEGTGAPPGPINVQCHFKETVAMTLKITVDH